MIKAVLFDLDNTLLDFFKIKTDCCIASVKAMIKAGLKMPEHDAYADLMRLYAPSSFEDDHIFERFLMKVNGVIDYKILSAAIVAYRRVIYEILIPYKGVISTLSKLKSKGLILGVVTDAPRLKAWIRLTSAGLSDFFDLVITLGDSKIKKPHKIPFNKALRALGLLPEQVLFVGDNLERDVLGANNVGMITAFAKYGSFIKEEPSCDDEVPDYVLDKFTDLIKLFD